jgi:hypothetical protein
VRNEQDDPVLEAAMYQRTDHRIPAVKDRRRPPWRLLIESPEEGLGIANFDAFRAAGFEVTVCAGPAATPGECPLVRGERCSLAADADIVLLDLDGDPHTRSAVLAALRSTRPELPVVVRSVAPPAKVAQDCITIAPTTSVNGQVAALRTAVLRTDRAGRTGRQ